MTLVRLIYPDCLGVKSGADLTTLSDDSTSDAPSRLLLLAARLPDCFSIDFSRIFRLQFGGFFSPGFPLLYVDIVGIHWGVEWGGGDKVSPMPALLSTHREKNIPFS